MTQSLSVVIGTRNPHKLRELKRLMRGSGVRVRSLADYPGAPEVRETGRTFEANAIKKALAHSRHTKALTLADDSGLVVPSLGGRPGVLSARFAGPGCAYRDNNLKLLRLLKNRPVSARRAKFVCVIAVYDSGKRVAVVRGECSGRITDSQRGRRGFGYDPVFIPNGKTRTFAEMSPRAKNAISHRGRALHRARLAILRFLGSDR